MTTDISNQDDVIDSRDVIERLSELENNENRTDPESMEMFMLKKLSEEAESSPDWEYGETLVRESYFTEYTKELINDCYQMPEEMKTGKWPFNHMTMDYEAAANQLKDDYNEVDFDGVTYFIRA